MKTDGTSPPTENTESIDDLLNRWATAGVLGISVRTLDRWSAGIRPAQNPVRRTDQISTEFVGSMGPESRDGAQSPAVSEASQSSKPFSQTPAKISTQAKDTPSGSASGVDDAPSGSRTGEGDHVQR